MESDSSSAGFVTRVLREALGLPAAERYPFVEERCAGNELARGEVLRLLRHAETISSFMEKPAWSMAGVPPRLAEGMDLDGRFRIEKLVGRGGMGEVYRATDLAGGTVAVKLIRAEWSRDPAMVALFQSEIRLSRKVSHPNVCRVHDPHTAVVDGAPLLFYAMEFLEGLTLSERIAERRPPDAAVILDLARQAGAGLDAVHQAGVLHCDLKPGNIFLAETGRIVITDFGIARASVPGVAFGGIGSADYMAPEQFLDGALTPATDVYALALTIFEYAAGAKPWPSRDASDAMSRRLGEPLPSLVRLRPDLPVSWYRVLRRAMAVNPRERYQSTAELATALGDAARRRTVTRRAWIGAAGIVVGAGMAWFAWPKSVKPALSILLPVSGPAGKVSANALDLYLRGQMRLSRQLRLLSPARIRAAWLRMAKGDEPENLTLRQAREIAWREGAPLVIAPLFVRGAGGKSALTVEIQLIGADPESEKRGWSKTFDPELPADDLAVAAAEWIRRTVGETEADLDRERKRPQEVTTSEPRALAKYMEAEEAWAKDNGAPSPANRVAEMSPAAAAAVLFESALAIDPGFASAAARLGDILIASGERDHGYAYYECALAKPLRRLTHAERFRLMGLFAFDRGDTQRAEQIFFEWALQFPEDPLPLFYRASALLRQGKTEQSVELYGEAIERDKLFFPFWNGRSVAWLATNRLDEASRDIEEGARLQDRNWTAQTRVALAFARRDAAGVDRWISELRKSESKPFAGKSYAIEACWRAEQGRLAEALRVLDEGMAFDARYGQQDGVVWKNLLAARIEVDRHSPDDAARRCSRLLAEPLADDLRLLAACVLAQAGQPHAAARHLDAWNERGCPDGVCCAASAKTTSPARAQWPVYRALVSRLRGEIALARGQPDQAVEHMRSAGDPLRESWDEAVLRAEIAVGHVTVSSGFALTLLKAPGKFWLEPYRTVAPGFVRRAVHAAAAGDGEARVLAEQYKKFLDS